MRTKIPMGATCKMKEIVVVNPRLVLSLPPDSIRLSSNIRFLLHRPYVLLDTAPSLFAPRDALGMQNPCYLLYLPFKSTGSRTYSCLWLGSRAHFGTAFAAGPPSLHYRRLPPTAAPILISHQNGRGDRNGRIRTDQNPDYQGKREAV